MKSRQPNKSSKVSYAGYLTLAWIFLGLGILGAFLPLLPTTVFIILAAWAFAKSSPEREAWLLNHPKFGPPLRDWRKYRAIPIRAKCLAYGLISCSALISMWWMNAHPWLLGITLVCLTLVVIYIHRIPTLVASQKQEEK